MARKIDKIVEYLSGQLQKELKARELRGGYEVVLSRKNRFRPIKLSLFFNSNLSEVVIRGAFSFLRTKKPRHLVKYIKRSLSEFSGHEVIVREKYINIRIPVEGEIFRLLNKLLKTYIRMFSEAFFLYSSYTAEEYLRRGINFFGKKLILVLLPYSKASEDLIDESRFMLYPTVTLPDSDGKYFISDVGFDYLYYPAISIASEKEKKYYIYIPTETLELKPYDIKRKIDDIHSSLESSAISYEELEKIFMELTKKPYAVYKYIDRIEELVKIHKEQSGPIDYFEARTSFAPRTVYPMLGFITSTRPTNERILKKIEDFIEKVKLANILDKNIEKIILNRLLVRILKDEGILITGKTISQRTQAIHKLGGGKAIYISEEEAKTLLGDKNTVKITLIEDENKNKKLIIEPADKV